MTLDAYAHMLSLAEQLADGLRRTIAHHALPWCVTQVGARIEFQFTHTPPRNGGEAAQSLDGELEHIIHLGLLNRGVMITPFHHMMLTSPATSTDDVQRLLHALDAVLNELTTSQP